MPKEAPKRSASPQPDTPRRVLIAFDPARWRYRGALRGINRFAARHDAWDLMLVRYHRWLWPVDGSRRRIDGIFIDAAPDSASLARTLDRPTVSLAPHPHRLHIPCVLHDHQAVSSTAYHFFRDRGFRHLSLFTTDEPHRLDAHAIADAFITLGSANGMTIPAFTNGPRTKRRKRWLLDDQIADLADWLGAQPQPLGLLAIDDEHAWRAVEAARLAGLRSPSDVAILGIGNDDCLCESARPAISSIILDYEAAGYEASRLLHALMLGDEPQTPRIIPPSGVAERASTDILAVDDPLVAQALTLIRHDQGSRMNINALARRLQTSRRTLYRRFIHALGRPPGEEIRRARLEAARKLIMHSNLTLVDIAVRVGFPTASQLSRDIERAYGHRPTRMRQHAGSM